MSSEPSFEPRPAGSLWLLVSNELSRTALVALILMTSVVFADDGQKTEPFIIGDAKMSEDGTIIVNMRRTTDGMNVSGIIKYQVGDPHYKEVLDHLGGMKPGDVKLVPAWNDHAPEKK